MWDVEGRQYVDFLSAYSAVNQGHCHPRLVAAMREQCARLTLSSRAFLSDQLGPYAEYVTQIFGFSRVLPMNTGAEGTETALKLARRWGYDVKGVPQGQATVIVAKGAFHGRTLAAVSTSDDPESYGGFGPLLPGIVKVPFDDIPSLRAALENSRSVVAFMVEPLQGEAGVVVPRDGYLKQAAQLCRQHNVIFIADEVQTGLCRTGRMLAVDYDAVKPDVLILGKALSGGMMPVSAVLANDDVMLTIKPGQHGSTFGGNPLACAVAVEALKVLQEEKLADNAYARGMECRAGLQRLVDAYPRLFELTRGKGLLNAIVVRDGAKDDRGKPISAWDLCIALKDAHKFGAPMGLLAKPTHGNIIRLAPPLPITSQQVQTSLGIIETVVQGLLAGRKSYDVHACRAPHF